MSAPSSWLVPKDRVLKAAKSAIYNIIPDGREMSYISAAIESVVPSLLLSTDLSSIYFSMADVKAEINDKPLFGRLGRGACVDRICLRAAHERSDLSSEMRAHIRE